MLIVSRTFSPPNWRFWTIQCYTVYGASFRDAGIWLLPIGFCIAGGAIISAGLMTVFKTKIHWILLGFCVIQTAGMYHDHVLLITLLTRSGLGSVAAADPDNINTCVGTAKSYGRECGNQVGDSYRQEGSQVLREMDETKSFSKALANLEDLADLLLCKQQPLVFA